MIKHFRNSIWSVAEGAGYPLLLLAATPIFLRNLGPADFGLWSLLTTITSVGMIVGVGTSAAIIKLVAEVGQDGELDVTPIIQGSMAIAVIAGGLLAVVTTVGISIASTLLLSKMGSPILVIATGTTAAILLWIEQFDTVFSSLLKGAERFGLAARLEIALKTLQILSSIVVVIAFKDIFALYIMLVVAAILRLATKVRVVRHNWPTLVIRPSIESSYFVLVYSKWGWLQGGGSLFFSVADRLIVGATLGSVSLGYYSIATQLAAQLHGLIANAFSIIAPRISQQTAAGRLAARFRVDIVNLISLNFALAVIGAILFLTFGHWILLKWVGENVSTSVADFFPQLVLAYFLLSISIVPYYFLNGLGRMKFVALTCISGGSIALISALILIPSHGMSGAAISRCMYSIISFILFFPLISKWRSRS